MTGAPLSVAGGRLVMTSGWRPRPVLPATREWFSGASPRPRRRRWGRGRPSARPTRARGRPHRFRQDACGLPVGHRPAGVQLPRLPTTMRRCRVLYVSPLKALAVDVERNLRSPLAGIRHAAGRLGLAEADVTRGGPLRATPSAAGRRLFRPNRPADILITTSESALPAPDLEAARRSSASRPSSSTRCTPSPVPSGAPIWPCVSNGSMPCWTSLPSAWGLSATVAPRRGGLLDGSPGGARSPSCNRHRPTVDLQVVVPVPTSPATLRRGDRVTRVDEDYRPPALRVGRRSGRTSRSAWST